jgi:hypothetical protein
MWIPTSMHHIASTGRNVFVEPAAKLGQKEVEYIERDSQEKLLIVDGADLAELLLGRPFPTIMSAKPKSGPALHEDRMSTVSRFLDRSP